MIDPNARYKDSFRALTEKLGRVPTSADKEWLVLHDDYKRGWQNGQWRQPNDSTPNYASGQRTTRVEDGGNHSSLHTSGRSVTGLHTSQRTTIAPQARATPETPAAGRPVLDAREGRQDQEALGRPGAIAEPPPEETTGEGGIGAVWGGEMAMELALRESAGEAAADWVPGPPQRLVQVGGRGPNGGVMALCDVCGRVWERPRRRGRPSPVCGECRGMSYQGARCAVCGHPFETHLQTGCELCPDLEGRRCPYYSPTKP